MAMKFDEDGLRNFKDFLLTYNKLSEACFNTCILNFNSRNLTSEEVGCADVCVSKSLNFNNKAVAVYMVEQPRHTEKRMKEAHNMDEFMKEMTFVRKMDNARLSRQYSKLKFADISLGQLRKNQENQSHVPGIDTDTLSPQDIAAAAMAERSKDL
ncbi:mitochondrial import inner membrane translocase subunit Tim10 B [Eurytemora carolleeae]|uniref:mitochondrial import inner membrane translocase subunit Tim10 B n=1 Tax=Eurytemora carolleeae TaxID=1294199 RepID=UPI000C76E79C|nr:mitochondrial import inner membrane translocase subunit Tim10 B [Eurytemora carolleeae]|eukprot:XP_023339156.1 mitochondrial import inner membrane translocase subunit Tim10 B-like [Eurytemora affinis]